MSQIYRWFCLTILAFICQTGACDQTPILRELAKLNPVFFAQVKELSGSSLYLAMKREESRPSIDEHLRRHLIAEYSGKHGLADLSDGDLKQFYINTLYRLYQRLAVDVLVERYTKWTLRNPPDELTDFAASLAALLLRPRDLMDRYLSVSAAEESLLQLPTPVFNWETAEILAQRWLAQSERQDVTEQKQVLSWLETQTEALALPYPDREKVAMALAGFGLTPRKCCVSTPGCFNCPANRRTLCQRQLSLEPRKDATRNLVN